MLNSRTATIERKTNGFYLSESAANHNGMKIDFTYNNQNYSLQFHVDRSNKAVTLFKIGDPYVEIWSISDKPKLTLRYVNVTVPANSQHLVNVSATVPTGSTFLCWVQVVTNGFVAGGYMVYVGNTKTDCWLTSAPSTQQSVTCYYLTLS